MCCASWAWTFSIRGSVAGGCSCAAVAPLVLCSLASFHVQLPRASFFFFFFFDYEQAERAYWNPILFITSTLYYGDSLTLFPLGLQLSILPPRKRDQYESHSPWLNGFGQQPTSPKRENNWTHGQHRLLDPQSFCLHLVANVALERVEIVAIVLSSPVLWVPWHSVAHWMWCDQVLQGQLGVQLSHTFCNWGVHLKKPIPHYFTHPHTHAHTHTQTHTHLPARALTTRMMHNTAERPVLFFPVGHLRFCGCRTTGRVLSEERIYSLRTSRTEQGSGPWFMHSFVGNPLFGVTDPHSLPAC